jgi:hypothetical protein
MPLVPGADSAKIIRVNSDPHREEADHDVVSLVTKQSRVGNVTKMIISRDKHSNIGLRSKRSDSPPRAISTNISNRLHAVFEGTNIEFAREQGKRDAHHEND